MKQILYMEAYNALDGMGKKVTGKIAFKLFGLKKKLEEIVQFQLEEEKKLIEKYEGVVNESGLIRFANPEKSAEFFREKKELYGMDYDIEAIEVDIDSVPDVTLEEIEALDGIVVFK